MMTGQRSERLTRKVGLMQGQFKVVVKWDNWDLLENRQTKVGSSIWWAAWRLALSSVFSGWMGLSRVMEILG